MLCALEKGQRETFAKDYIHIKNPTDMPEKNDVYTSVTKIHGI